MKNQNKKAFSLIELSIVILIIGIIIAGITQSSRLVELYRVSSAKTQTQSSPVHSTRGLVSWYETTLEESFLEKETEDYETLSTAEKDLYKGRVSFWKDISSSTGIRNNALQDTDANRPLYRTNCINNLPCVEFKPVTTSGVAESDLFLSFDGSKIGSVVGSDYTIFIVEKKDTTTAAIILGSSDNAAPRFSFGYTDTDSMVWSHDNGDTASITSDSSLELENNDPVLHVLVNENNKGFGATINDNFFYYTNGGATPETKTTSTIATAYIQSPYSSAAIGTGFLGATQNDYAGSIGEIIIFSRSLNNDERNAIENYLIKKWQIKPDNS